MINKIINKQINSLIPYINNPKQHPDDQVDKIASSIKNYGFTVPIVIDGQNEIIMGHGRLQAAKKLGMEEVPCIVRDDLTEGEVKALRIADNKVSESEWDIEILLAEIDGLEDFTGFDPDELEELNMDLTDPGNIIEDEAPEPPEEPKTKLGDLYILGRHRLLCGDSTKAEDVERLMDGKKADMVFTDPPYNVNYGEKANMLNDYQKEHRNTDNIKNDNMETEAFLQFLQDSFANLFIVTAEGGALYVCHAESTGYEFRKAYMESGFLLKQCLVWVKNALVIGRQDYQWKHEPILYGWKPGAAHKWHGGRKKTTIIEDDTNIVFEKQDGYYVIHCSFGLQQIALKVPEYEILHSGDDGTTTTWRVEKPLRNDVHPTMKPIALCARAIQNSSKAGDMVLDPFGGSGSTLIAAEQLNRICYMMELDPKYCDVIVERWENFTGQKAELVGE